jgi:cytidylate kinase
MSTSEAELLVFEYGGTARSGKGTIVAHLSETHEGVTVEETGADYRAVTRTLLMANLLEVDMPRDVIDKVVNDLELADLTEMVAERNALVEEHGLESLYTEDVNGLVGLVSPNETVRKAVKGGFKKRVEKVRDNGEHRVLLVDGRNLAPVVETVDETLLTLRSFVRCTDTEAAKRECAREGVQFFSDRGQEILKDITDRNKADKERTNDPVKPDPDTLDYWHSGFGAGSILRRGLATKAAITQRQICFDTDPFSAYAHGDGIKSKAMMLEAANVVFEEALYAVDKGIIPTL